MRKHWTIIGLAVTLMGLGTAMAPRIHADEWNQLTKVTFNEPVEVPGQVLLPGTYWFRLLGSLSDRSIVQIYNADHTKEVALILAVPDYRLQPTGKTVLKFEERAAGSPEAIKAWFYPGDNFGERFVYPKPRAEQLAKIEKEPVLSMPENLEPYTKMAAQSEKDASVMALKQATVKAEQPGGGEADVRTVVTRPPQLTGSK